MKIPRSFSLMGYTVRVKVVPIQEWTEEDALGAYSSQAHEIYVREGPRELMEHAFLHELTHAICGTLSLDKLYKDERFTDSFSGLLHQALTSAQYEGD